MAHTIEWGRQLLEELPEDPQELLPSPGRQRTYADPTFLDLFFDWLDELTFHDPQAGLRWARVAPDLARATPQEGGPEGRRAWCEHMVKAHFVLGGAYRATSEHTAADKEFRNALSIAEFDETSPEVRAELWQRLAILRASQGRPEEALELLAGALKIYPPGPCLDRSRVLIRRGYVLNDLGRFSEAVDCFGEALKGIQPEASAAAARAHHCAMHNLADGILKCQDASPWQSLAYIREAKRLLGGQRRSIHRHWLQWVEGLALRRLESCGAQPGYSLSERAEAAFNRARGGFIQLRAPWEIALVGLDLAALYRSLGRWDDLFAVASDTFQRFRRLSGNTQAVAALSLCIDAARARHGVTAAITAAQEVVAARAARSPNSARVRSARLTRAPRSTKPPAPPRRLRDAVKTRDALIKAAFEEIHRSGFSSPKNVKRILSTVGVTKGAIKHHFGNKQGLGDAVVDELARDQVLAGWVRPIDAADDPIDAIGAALTDAATEALGPLHILARGLADEGSGEAKSPPERVEDLYELWHDSLARNLARGQRQGTVRDDIVPEDAASCVIAFYEGAVGLARASRDPQRLEVCLREVRQYLDGMRPA